MSADRRRNQLVLTAHGRRRAATRGFTLEVLTYFAEIADREVPVGGRCVALSASSRAIAMAREEYGHSFPVDRLRDRVLIVAEDGVVVTALIADRRRGRHYSRHCRSRPRRASRPSVGWSC